MPVAIMVVHVEWMQPLEHGVTVAASCDGTKVHDLEILATTDPMLSSVELRTEN